MCFSATASFVTSGALVVAGAGSWKLATKSERLMALVPLLFAVQQALEGWQWLAVHPSGMSQALGYAYLFFAFLLWPTYLPLLTYVIETEERRRKWLRWLVVIGLCVSSSICVALFIYPLSVSVQEGNFVYAVAVPWHLDALGKMLYTLATVGALLMSSRGALVKFGLLGLATEIAAFTVYPGGFVSVWCFLAAVSSLCIAVYLYNRSRKPII